MHGFPLVVAARHFRTGVCAAAFASVIAARPVVAVAQTPVKSNTTSASPSLLEIRVSASRAQLSAGSGMGIVVTLVNTSRDSTIYLSEQGLMVTLPVELLMQTELSPSYYAYFPTEDHPLGVFPDSVVIALSPGATYPVSYNFLFAQQEPQKSLPDTLAKTDSSRHERADSSTQRSGRGFFWWLDLSRWGPVAQLRRYVGFVPGDYQLSVVAKFWTDPRRRPLRYISQSQTAVIHVAAPQTVILFGAEIGGVLAYVLLPSRRREREGATTVSDRQGNRLFYVWRLTKPYRRRISGGIAAMLWSAMVTILLARLSETQFVVRVSVNDFWGAITIGFVAQYVGSKWLERLFPDPASQTDVKRTHGSLQTAPAPTSISSPPTTPPGVVAETA